MVFKCRACEEKLTTEILNLSHQPPSNAYLKKNQLDIREINYPLKLYVCEKCWLVQLPAHTTAEELFTPDYAYFSSTSSSWCLHAKKYVENTIPKLSLTENSLVVEIASNDGYLLQYIKEKNIPCFGIEPTHAVAESSRGKGIKTIEKFFDSSLAIDLRSENNIAENGADLIIGNNVLAHVPEINDFLEGVFILLNEEGIASFEFPHLLKLLRGNQFDTIYHEQFSYFSLHTLIRICKKARLKVFDVEELETHGGSLRVWLTKKESKPTEESVERILSKENKEGLETLKPYRNLQFKAEKVKLDLLEFLVRSKKEGLRIFGYGAAAKGNTLMNYAGINSDLLIAVADKALSKQGKYLPGSHIPIISPEELFLSNPDAIIIFPWNLIDEFKKEFRGYKIITLIPNFNIHN